MNLKGFCARPQAQTGRPRPAQEFWHRPEGPTEPVPRAEEAPPGDAGLLPSPLGEQGAPRLYGQDASAPTCAPCWRTWPAAWTEEAWPDGDAPDLSFGPAGIYRFVIVDGAVTLVEGDEEAVAWVRMKADTALKIFQEKLSPMVAVVTGQIQVGGDRERSRCSGRWCGADSPPVSEGFSSPQVLSVGRGAAAASGAAVPLSVHLCPSQPRPGLRPELARTIRTHRPHRQGGTAQPRPGRPGPAPGTPVRSPSGRIRRDTPGERTDRSHLEYRSCRPPGRGPVAAWPCLRGWSSLAASGRAPGDLVARNACRAASSQTRTTPPRNGVGQKGGRRVPGVGLGLACRAELSAACQRRRMSPAVSASTPASRRG